MTHRHIPAPLRSASTQRPSQSGMIAACGLLCCLVAAPPHARGAAELDGLFSRHAVLQQGMPVPIFGTADDGDQITVSIGNRIASTVAKDGRWRVELEPLAAGGPYELRLGGATNLTVTDVYVGEVWVCAGQANMQWNVFNSKGNAKAMIAPENRNLHFYTVAREASAEPKFENKADWSSANAATIANFSAVGYYFGRELLNDRKVPIGLISCCHYLSNAEAWTDKASIAANEKLKRIVDDVLPDRKDVQTPGALYNGMTLPISQYAVRGVIWYQGENNVDHASEYQPLFSTLINDWRRAWGRPELPFLFVQIAPYKPLITTPGESKLAVLREAQFRTWQVVPHTAMVVTTDYGSANSLQPDEKEPIGRRLALTARAVAYGESLEYSGPAYREHRIIRNRIEIDFDHVGGGLQAGPGAAAAATSSAATTAAVRPASTTQTKEAQTEAQAKETETKPAKLVGFTICGADGQFVPADAVIEENMVVVTSAAVAKPTAVRYAWADFPVCNLYNREGLPATPFRTDPPGGFLFDKVQEFIGK